MQEVDLAGGPLHVGWSGRVSPRLCGIHENGDPFVAFPRRSSAFGPDFASWVLCIRGVLHQKPLIERTVSLYHCPSNLPLESSLESSDSFKSIIQSTKKYITTTSNFFHGGQDWELGPLGGSEASDRIRRGSFVNRCTLIDCREPRVPRSVCINNPWNSH